MTTRTLRLNQIIIPEHIHRLNISHEAITDLAASIEQHGLINPITVVAHIDDTYTLRAGHCRLLAHQHLGRTTIEATVREGSIRDTAGLTFAENLHRTQLSPMEEAHAIKHEHEDNAVPTATIARVLHRSEEWVLQRLMLTVMHPELCELVHTRELPMGSALALNFVTDDAHRRYLTRYAIDAGAAVHVIREWVHLWELQSASVPPDQIARPPMPQPGQVIVVSMPCALCGQAHPYHQLQVLRLCSACIGEAVYSSDRPVPLPAGEQEPATAAP